MAGPAALDVRPFGGGPGAEVPGIGLEEAASARIFPAVRRALLEHQMLVFPGLDATPEGQVAFARRFGPVQVHVMDEYHAGSHPELYTLSNLGADGRPTGGHPDRGTLYWHTDSSWARRTGLATCMYATAMPAEGGETHFCDMYTAWERLPERLREKVEGRRAVHSLPFSRTRRHGEGTMTDAQRDAAPPVDHPIVRTHPETGRRCLFLGDHAETVLGMDYAEGRALVEEVNAAAVEAGDTYRHRWRPRQFVVWDNRCLLHRATGYDCAGEARVVRRCTVIGEEPAP